MKSPSSLSSVIPLPSIYGRRGFWASIHRVRFIQA
jgi:hypothetical protein